MNEEELNEIESLDIVLNDVDDLDMGLEVISYKARVCIQELSNVVMKQSGQLQSYKQKEDKLRELVEENKYIYYTEDEAVEDCVINGKYILAILNEGEK